MHGGPRPLASHDHKAVTIIPSAPATTATEDTSGHDHGSSHDHAPAQKDFEGCAKGKYAWTDTGSTKAGDLGDAISDYAFSDGNKKASVYVDLDGLDALADADLCVTKVSETRVEFTAQFPSGKRCLTLSPLHASIDEASLLRKPGKNRVILKLKKTKPEAWSTPSATAPPPAQPDPSAMGGLGGMDMESMMKSMAGMAGVPDPPDLGADDTGADPEEAGSDLDDRAGFGGRRRNRVTHRIGGEDNVDRASVVRWRTVDANANGEGVTARARHHCRSDRYRNLL